MSAQSGARFSIIPMAMAHYPAARALWEATPWAKNGITPADDGPEGIEKFLARNPATCFVALNEGEAVVGTILCGHDGRRGSVYHMCVAENLQGSGLGRRLLGAALAGLREEGIRKAALVCFRGNTGGNAFWRRLGWQLREDLNYYGFVLDEA